MEFLDIAEAFLKAVTGELDPHTSTKGVIVRDSGGQSVSLFTPSHIQFAKYGRGPGKQPPVDVILKWVTTSGVIQYGSEKEALGTAWAIAKSISKKGTSNYVPNAPDVFEEAIGLHMSKFNGEINQRIVKITAEKVEKIFDENIPRNTPFKI